MTTSYPGPDNAAPAPGPAPRTHRLQQRPRGRPARAGPQQQLMAGPLGRCRHHGELRPWAWARARPRPRRLALLLLDHGRGLLRPGLGGDRNRSVGKTRLRPAPIGRSRRAPCADWPGACDPVPSALLPGALRALKPPVARRGEQRGRRLAAPGAAPHHAAW